MGDTDSLAFLDATAQARLVRDGELTASELLESAIARTERINPSINAVITPMYGHARELAAGQIPGGPFSGVPFLMKDFLAEYAGFRFTEGSAFLKDFVADHDTELVSRYKAAGLITFGKTNAPEMAIGVTTEPRLFGPSRNPWDKSRTTGGSSGGAAAAVAAGIVPMAHGNDAGGSIRIPASCCGLFGLKPTRGRNPLGPSFGDLFSGLVAEHVLTRSVRDSAAVLDATGGPATGEPYWAPEPERPFADEVGAGPRKLRIAFSTRAPLGDEVHADCVTAVRESAELCADLGHEVVEAAPEFDAELLWQSFTNVIASGAAYALKHWERRTGREATEESFEPFLWALTERGRGISAPDYLLVVEDMQRVAREVAVFFKDHDAWLTSTLGQPPAPLGSFTFDQGDPFELRRKMAAFSPYTYISNVTGQPAMTVPLYWNDDGLPIGSHFVGRYGDEATLLRLAAQLETARPWSHRRPPVSA